MMLWRGLKAQDILVALAAIGRRIDTNFPSEKFRNSDHDTPKSNRILIDFLQKNLIVVVIRKSL